MNEKSTETMALEYLADSMRILLLSKNIEKKRQIRKDIRRWFKNLGVGEYTSPNTAMAKIVMGIAMERTQTFGWKLACRMFDETEDKKMGGIKEYFTQKWGGKRVI